jgi:SAM-dependent methyltransferase
VNTTSVDFYDIPSLYDILHASGTAAEVDGLERMVMRFVRTPSTHMTWLEPACGTGRYLRVAGARGTRVIGVDCAAPMLDYARKRMDQTGINFELIEGDMRDLGGKVKPDSVDFAFNLINSIRHLQSNEAMLEHFGAVAAALKPGGIYAVGLSLAAYGLEGETEDVWNGSRGRCRVNQVVQYQPPGYGERFEQVVSHLTVTRPSGEKHYDSRYALRTYSHKQWQRLLANSAFELTAMVDEDGRDITISEPGYGIWILSRRLT